MPKKSHKKLLRNCKGSGKKSQRGGTNRSNSKQQLSNMKGGEGILEYFVVKTDDPGKFRINVNEKLKEGWKLQGGVSRDKFGFFLQAMTREKKIYEVDKVESIPEAKFENKEILENNNSDGDPYVEINKAERIDKSIFPGLNITITTNDGKTFKSIIKDVNSEYLFLQGRTWSNKIANYIELPIKSVVTLKIDPFQKISLFEKVTNGIKIGTNIYIKFNGEESEKTIKAMDINKKEIVLETPLET